MEKETIQKYIKYFQCKLATKYAKTWNNNLIKGKCVEETFEDIIVANYLIDLLYDYNYLDGTVTSAWSFTIERLEDGSVTIEIIKDGITLASYTGTDDTATILSELLAALSVVYKGFIDGNTLYIYSFDGGETFTTTPVVTISDATLLTNVTESLYGNLAVLTDRLNCLTYEELCTIKDHLAKLL